MTQQAMRFGCQTFTWEMLGNDWTGGADDLVDAIAAGGYSGIEITDTMIGDYAGRPQDFARRLGDAGLSLVSFAYGSRGGFSEPDHAASDLEACRRWADFAAHFPDALISMGSATAMSGGARGDKFHVAADIYNRSAQIGQAAGVTVALHPSSHHNTMLFDRADYDRIFALLDPAVGWVPDTGHILRGGQDMARTLADFADRICYVHLKDVDAGGDWAMLGAGICDIPAVLDAVRDGPRFNGWVVVEERSAEAARDPATAVRRNLATLHGMGVGDRA